MILDVFLLEFVFVGACFYQWRVRLLHIIAPIIMGITGCSGVKQLSYWYRNERTFVLMEGKANWKICSKFSAS